MKHPRTATRIAVLIFKNYIRNRGRHPTTTRGYYFCKRWRAENWAEEQKESRAVYFIVPKSKADMTSDMEKGNLKGLHSPPKSPFLMPCRTFGSGCWLGRTQPSKTRVPKPHFSRRNWEEPLTCPLIITWIGESQIGAVVSFDRVSYQWTMETDRRIWLSHF